MQPLTPRLRLILDVFAGLALIAGALLFLGSTRTDAWWSWTIVPPLTAATLGAFYWAAFVLILSAARSRTWTEARPAAYPVAVIAVLLLVVTLYHLDRFDLDSLFGVFWLVVYATSSVCPARTHAPHSASLDRFAHCSSSKGCCYWRPGASSSSRLDSRTISGPGRSHLSPRAQSDPS